MKELTDWVKTVWDKMTGFDWYKKFWKVAYGYYKYKNNSDMMKSVVIQGSRAETSGWKDTPEFEKFYENLDKIKKYVRSSLIVGIVVKYKVHNKIKMLLKPQQISNKIQQFGMMKSTITLKSKISSANLAKYVKK